MKERVDDMARRGADTKFQYKGIDKVKSREQVEWLCHCVIKMVGIKEEHV